MFQVEESDKKKWNPFVVLCGFLKWTGKDGTLGHGPHCIIHFENTYGEFQEKYTFEGNTINPMTVLAVRQACPEDTFLQGKSSSMASYRSQSLSKSYYQKKS